MLSLIPEPKQVRSTEKEPWRTGGEVRLQLTMEQDDPRLALHCQRAFPGREVTTSVSGAGEGYSLLIEEIVSFASAPDSDEADLSPLKGRADGYLLDVTASGAVIRALDAPGLYYGLQTLLQLQRLHGGDIPAVSITDWPDTELRVMNFDLRQTFSKPERLIEYLAEFSRFKTNAVLIEYEDKFPFRAHREFAHPQHALSREQLEALQAAAHEHYIEIIPLQQSFGHLEYVLRHDAWKHLRETEESTGEICPSHPQTYELITGLLAEMIDAHPESRYIHLGCDEVYSLCECEACREAFGGVRERAFISFLNRLIEFTASRGRQPIFWHDMLDKCPPEELAKLDPRSAAMIWIYNGRNIQEEVTSLTNKFRALGIEVMGAPAVRSFDWAEHQNYPVIDNRTGNLLQWAETAEKLDIRCMVATNWTGPFSLGVPYGVFETTWYPMLLHADLAWNRRADANTFIDRFLELFHGISPETGHSKLGNYKLEDYYDIIWKLREEVQRNHGYAELIAIMHDFEVATDRSRAIHKYAYRWELYPGDSAEWRSLLNNYTRNHNGREAVRPRMLEALRQYQPRDMAEHFVKSRFYLHDYLERTLYREIGLAASPHDPAAMSLEDKIALMCVVGTPSIAAEPEFRERMSGNRFGGIGLFPHNVKDEQQTLKLMAEVQAITGNSGIPQPYYVSIDEEGGTLSKFKTFYPYIPGNRAAGLSRAPETAYLQGKIIGSQLHALGIPMNWAPVLDVNTNIDNPVVGVRSFGEDPEVVAAFGKAYIQGMHEAGVAVTAKHFPGHGQVSGDSHVVLPECELSIEELMDGPLLPFIAAIEAGADSIMMGHLLFPNIPESDGLPASLSPFFAGELLRGRLGFEGIICTDDIEMGAIKKNFNPDEIGVLAVLAGNDMILMCHTPEFQERVIAGIHKAVLDGVIAESRIDESVNRILRLYAKFRQYRAAAHPIPREGWNEAALQYARRTVKVSRDPQQLLPLSAERSYLLILPRQEQLTIADNSGGNEIGLTALLEARGLSVQTEYCSMKPDAAEIANLCAKAVGRTVIQGTLNAHLFQGQLELAAQLAAAGPLLNLVLRNPYDDAYLPQNAGSILLCSTSDYSLQALAEVLVKGAYKK